jgi:hypothetical protein
MKDPQYGESASGASDLSDSEPQPPITVKQGALFGGLGAASVFFAVQIVQAVPESLMGNPPATVEPGLLGGIAVLGALAGSGIAFAAGQLRQWRAARQPQADGVEHSTDGIVSATEREKRTDRTATPQYVSGGILGLYIHLHRSARSETVEDLNSQ